MTYSKQTWVDGESGGTPLDAARLNHMETGIDDANTGVSAHVAAVDPHGDRAWDASNTTAAVSGHNLNSQAHASLWPTFASVSTGYINVKDPTYGAVGNGTTDDKMAIQNALNAASAAGGGVVFLPKGTYKIGGATGLTIASNVTLQGSGPSSIIKPIYTSACNYVINNNYAVRQTNIVLRDFAIDRSGANVQHAVVFKNVAGLLIHNVRVTGMPSTTGGAFVIGWFTDPVSTDKCFDVRVSQCTFANTDNFAIQLGAVDYATVVGNVMRDCYREVIGVEPGAGQTSSNVAIVGNQATTSTSYLSSSSTGMIVLTDSSGGTVSNVTVAGNVLTAETVISGNGNNGIGVYGTTGVSIVGNAIRGMNGVGIQIGNLSYGPQYLTVVGNSVTDCNKGVNASPNGTGIALRNAQNVTVSNNVITGSLVTSGVEETGPSNNNTISFNDVAGVTASTKIVLVGANSVDIGNRKSASPDLSSSGAFRATQLGTSHLGGSTPTGGTSGDLRVGTGGIWYNDAGSWAKVTSGSVGTNATLNPSFTINGTGLRLLDFQTAGSDRWHIRANQTAESGSNAGSDLEVVARDDSGNSLGNALTITRSTRTVTVGTNLIATATLTAGASGQSNPSLYVNGTGYRSLEWQTGGSSRWSLRATNAAESGSSVGSDLELVGRDDAGTNTGTVFTVIRSTGGFRHENKPLSFFGASPITKPTVSGAKGSNAALGSLLTALANLGLVTDSTTT